MQTERKRESVCVRERDMYRDYNKRDKKTENNTEKLALYNVHHTLTELQKNRTE